MEVECSTEIQCGVEGERSAESECGVELQHGAESERGAEEEQGSEGEHDKHGLYQLIFKQTFLCVFFSKVKQEKNIENPFIEVFLI
jgi:hypothetical protein